MISSVGDPRESVRMVCDDEIGSKILPIWGLDREKELNGTWRYSGVPNLWMMLGNLALCRFHSKHIALREQLVL